MSSIRSSRVVLRLEALRAWLTRAAREERIRLRSMARGGWRLRTLDSRVRQSVEERTVRTEEITLGVPGVSWMMEEEEEEGDEPGGRRLKVGYAVREDGVFEESDGLLDRFEDSPVRGRGVAGGEGGCGARVGRE